MNQKIQLTKEEQNKLVRYIESELKIIGADIIRCEGGDVVPDVSYRLLRLQSDIGRIKRATGLREESDAFEATLEKLRRRVYRMTDNKRVEDILSS